MKDKQINILLRRASLSLSFFIPAFGYPHFLLECLCLIDASANRSQSIPGNLITGMKSREDQ